MPRVVRIGSDFQTKDQHEAAKEWARANGINPNHVSAVVFVDFVDRVIHGTMIAIRQSDPDREWPLSVPVHKVDLKPASPIPKPNPWVTANVHMASIRAEWPLLVNPPEEIWA